MSDFIWHNPRCSKSRQTLALIEQAGRNINIIEYLKVALPAQELKAACAGLGLEPTSIIRNKEALFTELGLSLKDSRSEDEWLQILSDNPKLIERPIVCIGGHYALGRPPENVQKLL
ncbi:MAG: arsenate reductase (glutaredoxin) [Oceanococcus sp.]